MSRAAKQKDHLFEEERTLYDYFEKPSEKMDSISLTYTEEKSDVVLLPPDALKTFLEMGDKGFLKGKAFIDYTNLKEGRKSGKTAQDGAYD